MWWEASPPHIIVFSVAIMVSLSCPDLGPGGLDNDVTWQLAAGREQVQVRSGDHSPEPSDKVAHVQDGTGGH